MFAVLGQAVEVNAPVVVKEEDLLSMIAALSDVMRDAGNYGSCDSTHTLK
jgi:hypothetical protein